MVSELYGIKVKKSISNYSFYDLLTGKQHKQANFNIKYKRERSKRMEPL